MSAGVRVRGAGQPCPCRAPLGTAVVRCVDDHAGCSGPARRLYCSNITPRAPIGRDGAQEWTMLSKEENELLTRTGPGTPGGDLMRRYWQPVAVQDDLPEGSAPVPVRLLGEDLVLFRDESGQP